MSVLCEMRKSRATTTTKTTAERFTNSIDVEFMKNETWAKAKTESSNDENVMRAKGNFFSFSTVSSENIWDIEWNKCIYKKEKMETKKRFDCFILNFIAERRTENNLYIYWICSMLFDWNKIKVANMSTMFEPHIDNTGTSSIHKVNQ